MGHCGQDIGLDKDVRRLVDPTLHTCTGHVQKGYWSELPRRDPDGDARPWTATVERTHLSSDIEADLSQVSKSSLFSTTEGLDFGYLLVCSLIIDSNS